ncbi:MAG: hypothetical protein IJ583_14865 [Firmicutes bacterium]|nr:hypothetical protein [Bacillota bacterium]
MKRRIASAMCLVMMGVNLAAPVYASTTKEVEGEGSTTYVSTEHYEVIVPTTAALDFRLDPQNLLSLADNEKKSVDSLKTSSVAGAIYGSDALVFANLGTDDVSVSVNFAVTGDATALAHDGTVVADPTDTNSALNVKLALVPYEAERDADVSYKMDSTANAGLFKATETAFKSGEDIKGVAFDNENSTFSFKLAAPSWNITKLAEDSYTLEMDQKTNDKAVAFKIGGECNSKADWSDFTGASPSKTVGLTATFTLDKAATGFTPDVTLDLENKTVAAASGTNLINIPVLEAEEVVEPQEVAVEADDIAVDGKEITITGFTGTAEDVSVKIDGEEAAETAYTVDASSDDSLKVTLAEDSTADREVVVTFTVGIDTYTATATIEGVEVELTTVLYYSSSPQVQIAIPDVSTVDTTKVSNLKFGDTASSATVGTTSDKSKLKITGTGITNSVIGMTVSLTYDGTDYVGTVVKQS